VCKQGQVEFKSTAPRSSSRACRRVTPHGSQCTAAFPSASGSPSRSAVRPWSHHHAPRFPRANLHGGMLIPARGRPPTPWPGPRLPLPPATTVCLTHRAPLLNSPPCASRQLSHTSPRARPPIKGLPSFSSHAHALHRSPLPRRSEVASLPASTVGQAIPHLP
jgi:hypothetical protein